jgi:hypothetical protein
MPQVCSEISANEFAQLAQGVGGRVTGTNTIFFIKKDHVPINRRKDVTYGSLFVSQNQTKKKNIVHNLLQEETESITRKMWELQQQT